MSYIELSAYGFIHLPDGSTEPADNGRDGGPQIPEGWCVYAITRNSKNHEIVGDLFEEDFTTEEEAMNKADELKALYKVECNYY